MDSGEIGAGDTLGNYELLVPLAQGGTAAVWAARPEGQRGAEHIVALKMMLTDVDEDLDMKSMLLDEARTVSRIRHANVAAMLEAGEVEDVVFLVMEFVDGEQLNVVSREARRAGEIPVSIAVGIAAQVAAGLHAAHELRDDAGEPLGIVHRDVSPQNLLVGHDGIVKIIDFGVAKATSNLHRTTVGQIKGKAGFMAPEQTKGSAVDRRTDVFALGVVLFQLLTGKHPFRGDNEFAIMMRLADATPAERVRALRPNCPAALEDVVAKALAKPKDERFADMQELERALRAAVPDAADAHAIAAFAEEFVGARRERRWEAIRAAAEEADAKRPAERVPVDKNRFSRSSERPLAFDDSEVHDRAAMPNLRAAGPPAAGATADPSA
ncbi:MAG TPA: serine/threonine-protein kinase, partial [Minicystis sp.]|nr:serine/threonine-protein kinase [Minicystis sp.]